MSLLQRLAVNGERGFVNHGMRGDWNRWRGADRAECRIMCGYAGRLFWLSALVGCTARSLSLNYRVRNDVDVLNLSVPDRDLDRSRFRYSALPNDRYRMEGLTRCYASHGGSLRADYSQLRSGCGLGENCA